MKKFITFLCGILLLFCITSCKNVNYEELIDFPARTEDNTCSINVSYFVYYPTENANALYADVEIEKFSYTFQPNKDFLNIDFYFECHILDMYEGAEYFAFEIVAYNKAGIRIETLHVYGEGDTNETVRVETTLVLAMRDVEKGITIDFSNYER
ncbi:MAG: hypothetical protein J6A63_06125 [Clostridia bacterium]|nr:hypothetical protein [Clostridia bacterium]